MFPRHAADGDFDHVKYRTQPVRKERGLGTQEDLNEEVREYYSQLVPKIQQQFQKYLLRIVHEHVGAQQPRASQEAELACDVQDEAAARNENDTPKEFISKSEINNPVTRKISDSLELKKGELNQLTQLILMQLVVERGH